ncbi:MAG: hypothetical protein ACM3X4_11435 [Ignavibacteriales bacterium]
MEPLSILIFIFFWVISSIISSKNRQRSHPGERKVRPGQRGAGWPGGPQQPGWPAWGPRETAAPPQAAPAVPTPAPEAPAPAPSAPVVVSAPTATTASAIPQERPQAAAPAGVEPGGDGEAGLPAFLTGLLDPQSVLTGIVFSEVIGPPKARRLHGNSAERSRRALRTRWSGIGR